MAKGSLQIVAEGCMACGFCFEFCITKVLALSSTFKAKGCHTRYLVHPENAVVAICVAYTAPTSQSLTTRIPSHPGKKLLRLRRQELQDAMHVDPACSCWQSFSDVDHARCEAALAGDARFSAGYPITASREAKSPLSKAGEIVVCKFVDRERGDYRDLMHGKMVAATAMSAFDKRFDCATKALAGTPTGEGKEDETIEISTLET